MKPKPDEIEVSVFGPGYGECIVVHVGSGKWAIIDSCLDDQGKPISLSYLQQLGVSVETDVISISASHWHDDHVKGLAETIEICRNAKFSSGSAMLEEEFLAFLCDNEIQQVQKLDKGGTELHRCIEILINTGRSLKPLSEDTIIFEYDPNEMAHGLHVELRALSPSGKQFAESIQHFAKLNKESKGQPRGRINKPSRNDLSVAMIFSIGEQTVLFGADLEQDKDTQKGWNAILSNRRGRLPSNIFKIPHHGSSNAHNSNVWREMIKKQSWSVVTPFKNGSTTLPMDTDVTRIKKYSQNCFITSSKPSQIKKRYNQETIKLFKSMGPKLIPSIFSEGRVTFRWNANDIRPVVELSGTAKAL